MHQRPARIDPENVRFIEETVRAKMAGFAIRDVRVRPGFDHAEEPAILIDVDYDLNQHPITADVITDVSVTIWMELVRREEDRFPYLRHNWHDGQPYKRALP
jgi:hypothetical protein